MPFDEDAEDERPESGPNPLPPEDRLWRHPSELGPMGPGMAGRVPDPLSLSWAPTGTIVPGAIGTEGRRSSWASVAALSCLAGAVIAMGVVLATRPATRIVRQRVAPSAALRSATTVVFKQLTTEQLAAQVTPAVARLDVQGPKGWQRSSAVLIRSDGTLVTSAQVVSGYRKLVVTFDHDRSRRGALLGVDPQTGIAVITMNVNGRDGARVGAAGPKVGQPAVMVGGPARGSQVGTVSTGSVRGLNRQMEGSKGTLHGMIEMDRPVADDTAGGALVDNHGRLLGICLQGKATALGYAVPIGLVLKVGEAIRREGKVRWGRLGVKATDLDPGEAQDLGIPGAAVLMSVEEKSAAAQAGLVKGDLVTQLGATRVESAEDLVAALSEHHPGELVVIKFRRGTASRWVGATLGTN